MKRGVLPCESGVEQHFHAYVDWLKTCPHEDTSSSDSLQVVKEARLAIFASPSPNPNKHWLDPLLFLNNTSRQEIQVGDSKGAKPS